MRSKTRGLPRLPVRVEPPRGVFNPTVLNGVGAPGRRILSNATPVNGLSAPTRDRPEDAECNAPPISAASCIQNEPASAIGVESGEGNGVTTWSRNGIKRVKSKAWS